LKAKLEMVVMGGLEPPTPALWMCIYRIIRRTNTYNKKPTWTFNH